jgi:putative multicomponent Na+:H+ antiporter subunit B
MDSYVYIIVALLPLAAAMVIFQTNPYHALVIRGILGAIAALVYTVLGAPDVALTEALVGTLLAISLYAVAVRSSLVLRLGVLKDEVVTVTGNSTTGNSTESPPEHSFPQLLENLRAVFGKHYMRVELVPYMDEEDLHQALLDKDVHAICAYTEPLEGKAQTEAMLPYTTTTRLPRIYEILQTEMASTPVRLSHADSSNSEIKG